MAATPDYDRAREDIRSFRQPMWERVFINRNPAQAQRNYKKGRDAFAG